MQPTIIRSFFLVLFIFSLAACAPSPVAPDGFKVSAYGPAHVLAGEAVAGDRVVWGGRIVAIENLAGHTELIVASYPLDRSDRPRTRQPAGVRFVLIEEGFLEPVDWSPGRYVTVLGLVEGIEERTTGEFIHAHPVMRAENLHLWPVDQAQWRTQTGFNIGIGIRL